jgi:hypothetical protein
MNEVFQAKKYLLSHSTTSAIVLPDPYRTKHVHCIDALKEKFNSILKHILLSSKEKKNTNFTVYENKYAFLSIK